MEARAAKFLYFLKQSDQFVIPIYQRTYSWTERECAQLWEDIQRTGGNDDIPAHFTGSIVYIEKGLYQVSSQSSLLVIDGQQRITTVMLILEALARHVGDGEPVDGFSARKLRNYYLLNQDEKGERRFKLLLTQTDKQSLLALIQQQPEPDETSFLITENFKFFEQKVRALGPTKLAQLCQGLAKLMIVDIALSRDQDNPQLIFESMNSTGRELSQADLIRNFILMGLKPDHQTRLYNDYWRPMEIAFGQEAYGTHFNGFMRHYLTFKMGEIPNVRAVYEAFKGHARSSMAKGGVDALVADVRTYAGYYCAMALDKEKDEELKLAFGDLRELKVDVAFPLLLELYNDYAQGQLPKDEFVQAVRLVEAYVFRRTVCAIPTNSHNRTFASFGPALRKDRSIIQSIQAHLLSLPYRMRFPSDEEFKHQLSTRDLYNFPRRSYWLRRLENHDRKEPVPVNEYTIEHIMPQNENLLPAWQKALGPEWERVHKTWLHTLGNLTLTGYNTEYKDRPFSEKRDMQGGFKESPLRLNETLRTLDTWNECTIQERAGQLAAKAVQVWSRPNVLPADEPVALRTETESPAGYILDDHAYLASNSPMRQVFETFRKEVLALDSCIREKVLKRYVAYKAETNFVDVEPQKSQLRLSLNLKFHELHDPRGSAKDVTNLGRLGNGDAEVQLSTLAELPYVMGLVRQAFEKQMGDEMLEA